MALYAMTGIQAAAWHSDDHAEREYVRREIRTAALARALAANQREIAILDVTGALIERVPAPSSEPSAARRA